MGYSCSNTKEKTTKNRTKYFTRMRSAIIASVIFIALLSTVAFSSTSAASSLSDLLFGGTSFFNLSGNSVKTVEPLNSAQSNSFLKEEPTSNIARSGHTATDIGNGRVLLVGGDSAGTAEILDFYSGTSSFTGSLSISRTGHTATVLSDGRVLIAGGFNNGKAIASTEIYDNGVFLPGPSLIAARARHTATVSSDGRIFIVGGDARGSIEILDAAAQSSQKIKSRLITSRSFHSAELLQNGKLLIIGGSSNDDSPILSGEILNLKTMEFSEVNGSLHSRRILPLLRELPDGKVQIIGGNDEGSMEMFTPEGNYFSAFAHVIPGRNPRESSAFKRRDAKSQVYNIDQESKATRAESQVMKTATRAALINNGEAEDSLLNRSDYSLVQIRGTNKVLVTGGKNHKGETLKTSMAFTESDATVTTDKLDYPPGETVTISGTGWQPGEMVKLTLVRDREPTGDGQTDTIILTAVADTDGKFVNTDYTTTDEDSGATFVLTAVGQTSGKTAQTTFTDGAPNLDIAPAWHPISSVPVRFSALVRVTGGTPNPGCVRIAIPLSFTGVSLASYSVGVAGWTSVVNGNNIRLSGPSLTSGSATAWARFEIDAIPTAASSSTWSSLIGNTTSGTDSCTTSTSSDTQIVRIGSALPRTFSADFRDGSGNVVSETGDAGTPKTYRLRITNTSGGSGDDALYATIALPDCFTGLSSISATTSNGTDPDFSVNSSSGNVIRLTGGLLKKDVNPDHYVQVQFTVTPSGSCSPVFRSTLWKNDDTGGTKIDITEVFSISGAQPVVNVTSNTPPVLGNYPNTTVNLGSGTTVTPDAAPTDNGTVATLTASAPGFTGTFSGNTTTGVITITTAGPSGTYTVTVTATDNLGATTTTTFQLTVNAPPTITGATISRQQGSPASNSQIATVNDAEDAENTLAVTVNGGASATVNGVTVSNIVVDASGNVTADVVATCTATNATFTLTVTDSNGASNTATLTVNVTPNTPPSVGTYPATSVNAGSGTTVTPSAAPADNGSIVTATVMASAGFTGTLSVDSMTGVVTVSNANPVGSYTVTVTYTDNCGATTSPAFTLNVIDVTPPDTTITANPSDPSGPNVSFSFTGTDAESGVASFECQLDGGGFTACTSPKTYMGLSQGSHTFEVRAIDNASNVDPTPASFTWNVDATAPDTTINTSPPNPSNSGNASFTFSSNETGTFECDLDGGGFTACTSPQNYAGLSDGSHTFMVRAVDGVGNVDATPASYTWVVDTTGPETTITANPPDPSNSNSASFSFTGTDTGGSGVASFECQLDGGGFSACTSPQNYTGLSDGSHTFEVRAIDNAGNTDSSPSSYTWTVDTAPPDTTITSNPTNPSNSSSPTFQFTGTDSGTGVASFECQLDGGGFAACTSPKQYIGLSDGSHTFQVRAIDNSGNVDPSPASYTWTVDSDPPDVTINQAAGQSDPANGMGITIHFTAVFNEPVTGFMSNDVMIGGTAGATTVVVTEIAPMNGTTYNVAVSGMTMGGTVTASIPANRATDAAGNGNTASTSTDNTVTYVPNTPPTANPDSYTTTQDTPLTVAAPGVLGNDSDPDAGNTITAVLVSGPTNAASFTLNANGSFNYTPAAGFTGTDSFTYKARDNFNADSNTVTVTLSVKYRFAWFYYSNLLLQEQVINQVTAGSNVPVRFTLYGYKGDPYSMPPTSQPISCSTFAATGPATTINRFAPDPYYSTLYDFYQTTWQTQTSWKFTCRRLTLHFKDGTTQSLIFYFK